MKIREHPALAMILVLFIFLGIAYSIITPIFEAGDEIWHYPFVQHLATGHSLPIQDPAVKTLWAQEGGQPPLYYALAALATFWIDTRDLPERLWYNPHAKIGIPLLFGNKNLIVHTAAEEFPWHNTALAVHLVRFLSLILSTATIVLTYFLALEIRSGDKMLAAACAALVAFNPMFIFISASVNNDNLAVMLASLALVLLARLIRRGATIRRFIVLGIVLGLAALSKVSDAGLIALAAPVFLYLLWRERSAAMVAGSAVCALLVAVIAGWWYVRNFLLYDDPLAFNVWLALAGGRPQPATLASLLDEFQGFRISFWGNFGGVNIIAPEWVYLALDALTILAAAGLVVGLAQRTLPRLLALPTLWLAIMSVGLVRWTMLTLASQGRLIFPAISAVAILMACGFSQLRIPSLSSRAFHSSSSILNLSFIIFLFVFSAFVPFTLIAPAYALPTRLTNDSSVPDPTHIVFEDQAELVGYALPQRSVMPGGELPITLYWRAPARVAEDFSVYIHLFGADGKILGQWDAFPGNGLYPTRLWQPGEVIVDPYRVPLASDARGPAVARAEVGLYRKATLNNLIARDPQGRTITPTIARFKIAGQTNVRVENPVRFEFADKIALVGYSLQNSVRAGDTIHVKLYWRALNAMDEDYTVFVHLIDGSGTIIAQQDDQPQRGTYPTSFWDAGELIADEYALAIPSDAPPSDYRIEVGIYRAGDGPRLPVPGGDHITLATVSITR